MAVSSCNRGVTCGADRYRSGRYALASDRGLVASHRQTAVKLLDCWIVGFYNCSKAFGP